MRYDFYIHTPGRMMFSDNILLCSTVKGKLEHWRTILEYRGHNTSGQKTEYLSFNGDQDREIRAQEKKLNSVDRLK